MNALPLIKIYEYFRIYLKYIGNKLYFVFFLSFVSSILEGIGIMLLLPLLTTWGMDDAGIEKSGLTRVVFDFLDALGVSGSSITIILFIVSVITLKGILKYYEGAYVANLQAELRYSLTKKLFQKYSTMQYEYYTKHDSGHIVNQLVNQIPGFVGSFVAFKNFFTLLITVIIYYSFAMIANINFAIFATLIGILIMIIFKKFSYKHKQLSRKTVRELSLANKHIVQSIQAYKYLSATNQMNYLKLELVRCLKNVAFNQRNQVKMTALTNASKEPISVIFMMMIIVIQMSFFEVNIPSIIVVLLLMNRALGSIFDMQSAWQSTMTNIGSLESIENNFHELSENQEVSGSIVLPSFCRNIVMKDLYFAYDKGDGYALKNINLTLNANETVAFVGHSGSGKSTLSDLIVALLRPSKGDLFIDGVSIKEIDVESWRDKIGYISQDVVIFDDTISNNIGMWNGDNLSSDEYILRVNDAAKKAGILEFVNTLKDGFDTKVGDRGVRLSGGQKQRLFIARELYRRPKILILDEATSALDSKSEKIIESSINKLSGEMTIIMIAHRLSTIKNADRIVVLDEGVVVQSGSYEELVSLPGMFKEMVELQFS